MKIAITTDDGKIVSRHFGRALYYLVLTIEEGRVVNREMREKLGHQHFHAHEHPDKGSLPERHGFDEISHNKHSSMAEVISDCEAVVCGGMGLGAYESMNRLHIKPILTDLAETDSVEQAFLAGNLVDHKELLH